MALPEAGSVILGLWPIAGITTIGVTDADRDATMAAAIDHGIRSFDTAFAYGLDGESDRCIRRHVQPIRDRCTVISKVGQRYDPSGRRYVDARPETLRRDAIESLRRCGLEHFDLLMLHQVDPAVPLQASAAAMADLRREGLTTEVGVCNVTTEQLATFGREVAPAACQLPLNLMQSPQAELLEELTRRSIAGHVYWTLMKGLLAGRITRDHVFAEGDSRPNYEIFQGDSRKAAHDLVDRLGILATNHGCSVAALSIAWTLGQPGVTAALVGARRPEQIPEIAEAAAVPAAVVEQVEAARRAVL